MNLEFRHCEERSDEAIHSFFARRDGLLRCARNDGLAIVACFKIESENCAAVRPRFWWCVDLSGSAKTTPDIRYAEISPAFAKATAGNLGCFARWDGNGLPTEAAKQRRLAWPATQLLRKPLKICGNSFVILDRTNAHTNSGKS